ncbi:hypothetical protein BGZ76_004816 [Entomortierella beljakovae]|nr:hypothetical protein BGZ76_004816 [Entomortierella beljakovae]
MIPAKRSSPFVRARSFQNGQGRGIQGSHEADPSPSKRPTFSRAQSSPFQVLSRPLKNTRNPFEKLSQKSTEESSNSTLRNGQPVGSTMDYDSEDEQLDPNQTLKMFSLSQSAALSQDKSISPQSDSEDDGQQEEVEENSADITTLNISDSINKDILDLDSEKPRLRDALAISIAHGKSKSVQELHVPESSGKILSKSDVTYKTSPTLPIDWTLKTSLSITSQDSLKWCDQSSAMDEIEALQRFISNPARVVNLNSDSNSCEAGSARARLLPATYYWTYPANMLSIPQTQSVNKLMNNANNLPSADKRNISEIFSRKAEWKQSFTTLYQSCRNGACPYFYYIGTAWTILIKHGSISLSGEMEAILTNSTPGLRQVLKGEEIRFERLPNTARKTTVHHFSSKNDLANFDDDNEDDDEVSSNDKPKDEKGSQFQSEHNDLSDSLLFKGTLDVHGLFSYLLNLKTTSEDGLLHQSPTLISGFPFLHAALKKSQISKCRVVNKFVEGTEQMRAEFRVDIQGIILPTSIKELSYVFADLQSPNGYSCVSSSEARSLGLNLRPLSDDQKSVTETEAFVSSKALDQLRYSHNLKQYSWS